MTRAALAALAAFSILLGRRRMVAHPYPYWDRLEGRTPVMTGTVVTVTTQEELDAALADDSVTTIRITSPVGRWLRLSASGGSSTVRAYGSSTVRASGSSTVEAHESSTVEAYGSSTVAAHGSSTVVSAYDSSAVSAYDSSTVRAYGSSVVRAYGSSVVRAYESSTVEAHDSSVVRAYESSVVRASTYVAVHLFSAQATINGGVVIDVTQVDTNTPVVWVDYHGVPVRDGWALVYKAVDADLNAGQGHTVTNYPIGGEVIAADWKPTRECGNGLHFGYRPHVARRYFNGTSRPRFLACEVEVASMVALGDKCKAPRCRVLYEVDIAGRQLGRVES